jgi:hypothetical protein
MDGFAPFAFTAPPAPARAMAIASNAMSERTAMSDAK